MPACLQDRFLLVTLRWCPGAGRQAGGKQAARGRGTCEEVGWGVMVRTWKLAQVEASPSTGSRRVCAPLPAWTQLDRELRGGGCGAPPAEAAAQRFNHFQLRHEWDLYAEAERAAAAGTPPPYCLRRRAPVAEVAVASVMVGGRTRGLVLALTGSGACCVYDRGE